MQIKMRILRKKRARTCIFGKKAVPLQSILERGWI